MLTTYYFRQAFIWEFQIIRFLHCTKSFYFILLIPFCWCGSCNCNRLFIHGYNHTFLCTPCISVQNRQKRMKGKVDQMNTSIEKVHSPNSCAHAQTVRYVLLLQLCPQELRVFFPSCARPKAHRGKMKPIPTEAEVYCKPVKRYSRNARCPRPHLGFPLTCKKTHARCSSPRALACLCSGLLPVDADPRGPWGRGLRAPECCFSSTLLSKYPPVTDDGLHLSQCSGFSLGLWLTATLRPHCCTNHNELCSGNITQDRFPLLSSCSLGSCFTGNAQRQMGRVPLFKVCFGYISFSFFKFCLLQTWTLSSFVFLCEWNCTYCNLL